MNLVEKTRKDQNVSVKNMGEVLHMTSLKYLIMEKLMKFDSNDYKKICRYLKIDYDSHF